ncbi:MAG: glycosyltransferase [Azospira oryzae]|nr:MAG: glycosyltransferase [Azospira oryzae]
MRRKVSMVIPVYNESVNVGVILQAIRCEFKNLDYHYEVIFVDDGSSDDTLDLIKEQALTYDNVFYLRLSRNYGHQNALKAGLDNAKGDCVISMDGDMQHPPSLLPKMLAFWEQGYEVVYTRRLDTEGVGFFKKLSSKLFYKVINFISDVKMEDGVADFRLLDKKVVAKLKEFKETDLFLRGLVKWVGFNQVAIDYKAAQRHSGKTKYSLSRMIAFAVESVTSFSVRPLIFSVYLGFILSLLTILIYIPYLANAVMTKNHFPRWASILSLVAFFGGLNLTLIGIVGIYIGKLFMQSKARPNYIISETNKPIKEKIPAHDIVEF